MNQVESAFTPFEEALRQGACEKSVLLAELLKKGDWVKAKEVLELLSEVVTCQNVGRSLVTKLAEGTSVISEELDSEVLKGLDAPTPVGLLRGELPVGDFLKGEDKNIGEIEPTSFAPFKKSKLLALTEVVIRDAEGVIAGIRDISGRRQVVVAQVPFLLNETQSAFRFSVLDRAIDMVYADKKGAAKLGEWERRSNRSAYENFARQAYYSIEQRFQALEELDAAGKFHLLESLPNLSGLLAWIREQKVYAALTIKDIGRVFRRTITFEELLHVSGLELDRKDENGISPLTDEEIYWLGTLLLAKAEAMGIYLDPTQRCKIEEICDGFTPELVAKLKPDEVQVNLVKKITSFVKAVDKRGVFFANSKKGQHLLLPLAEVEMDKVTLLF